MLILFWCLRNFRLKELVPRGGPKRESFFCSWVTCATRPPHHSVTTKFMRIDSSLCVLQAQVTVLLKLKQKVPMRHTWYRVALNLTKLSIENKGLTRRKKEEGVTAFLSRLRTTALHISTESLGFHIALQTASTRCCQTVPNVLNTNPIYMYELQLLGPETAPITREKNVARSP